MNSPHCATQPSTPFGTLIFVPLQWYWFVLHWNLCKRKLIYCPDTISLFFFALRYLAIVQSLRYKSLVTRPRCILVVLFIWLTSAITASVQFSWLDPVHHDPHEELSKFALIAELIYDIIFLSFFFLLPFALMCFTYGSILFEIVRQSRNIQLQNLPSSLNARRRNPHERKAIAIFAAMLLVYIICWLPYFGLRRFDLSELPTPLIYVVIWLRYLASLLNPCMYIFGKYDYRKALWELLRPAKTENNFLSTKSTILRSTLGAEMNELGPGERATMVARSDLNGGLE